jgi:hypothetical protein
MFVLSPLQAVDDVAPAVDDAASQQLAAAASEAAQLRARIADAERAAAGADEVCTSLMVHGVCHI